MLGADDGGEANLTYTWAASGPAPVTFSVNGANIAKSVVATFTQAGTYQFTVTITNPSGLSATSSITVTVNQTFSGLTVSPAYAVVGTGAPRNFTATANDQFGAPLAAQPTFTWSVASGGGSVNQAGVYTAPYAPGSAVVQADAAALSATAAVRINLAAPGAPTGLTATAGNSQATLSWTAPPDSVSSYNLYRGTAAGAESNILIATGITGTAYTDTGLTNGQTYFYTVAAINSAGTGTASGEASATPSNAPPTVATAASASPSPVTGTTTGLSVLGADDLGESNLTYTWAASGPAAVTFSANGTNAAKNTVAAFTQAGVYSFTVTLTDSQGASVTSSVSVTVNQTLTAIAVSPAAVTLAPGATQQFAAAASDQFGQAMSFAPLWSVTGGGSVSSSGLFTAGAATGGPFTLTAGSGAVSGTAGVTVAYAAPTVAAAASATPNPVTGKTASASVLGADAGGESKLTYAWTAAGPASVTFSAKGTNAAKKVMATFTQVGSYTLTATITNSHAKTAASSVQVTVNQTLTTLTVTPTLADVPVGGTQQFTASATDQFGKALGVTPSWKVSGGTVSAAGLYQATAAGGPFNVTAAVGTRTATAQVSVPSAPTHLTATAGNGQAALSWTKPAGTVLSYTVTYGAAPGAENVTVAGITGMTALISGLTNGQTYYFIVRAVFPGPGGVGFSGPNSAEASATPSLAPTLMPIADSYVWSGTYAAQNKGGVAFLSAINTGSPSLSGDRCAYLKFDLTSVTQAPNSARLSLTVDSSSRPSTAFATAQVYSVSDTSWTETGINWNNAPGLNTASFTSTGTLLGSQSVSLKAGSVVTYDLTAFVSAHLGQAVTVQIFNPNADGVTCNFVSREGASGKPTLALVY